MIRIASQWPCICALLAPMYLNTHACTCLLCLELSMLGTCALQRGRLGPPSTARTSPLPPFDGISAPAAAAAHPDGNARGGSSRPASTLNGVLALHQLLLQQEHALYWACMRVCMLACPMHCVSGTALCRGQCRNG